jgi:ribosomal 30S subunit maturation factor RimM
LNTEAHGQVIDVMNTIGQDSLINILKRLSNVIAVPLYRIKTIKNVLLANK